MIQKIFLCVILLISFSGCSQRLIFEDPRLYARRITQAQGFEASVIQTQTFHLSTFSRMDNLNPKYPITIYIEGDGHSWINRYQISPDPTPHNPLALKLAMLDTRPNVIYLARPCQYGTPNAYCKPSVWTDERFSEEVIASMNEAVDSLKQKYQTKSIQLIGFSGGAAVAVLIAARRQDVTSIITVAGDLDHEALSADHKTTPLKGSLNPKNVVHKIAYIPQLHLIGDKDPVVPLFLSESFVNAVNGTKGIQAKRIVMRGFTHHEGWEETWQDILRHQ
jgi:Serine hydrolase (FSH1)